MEKNSVGENFGEGRSLVGLKAERVTGHSQEQSLREAKQPWKEENRKHDIILDKRPDNPDIPSAEIRNTHPWLS